MALVQSHPSGSFCWLDLGTTDARQAKEFYTKLFGWEALDTPMGDGSVYTMLKMEGHEVGALYELSPEMRAQGIASHWMLYVSVASADEIAARVPAHGGAVLGGPFDVFEHGRMTLLKDPQGAAVAAWQPKSHAGAGIVGEIGTMCWAELNTSDAAGARAFYPGVFGWEARASQAGGNDYTEWYAGGKAMAGMMQIQPEWGPVPSHWLLYLRVGNCQESVDRATGLGGKVIVPPMDIPKVGTFSILQDPTGGVFAVIALEPA